jgi:hypothetical protein
MEMRQGLARLGGSLAALIALAASSAALAQSTTTLPDNYTPPAHESCCKGSPPPLTPTAASNLEANLGGLLGSNQTGGGQLIASVRDLLLSDSGALPGLLDLLKNANPDQKSAIASAFGQAARLWNGTDQDFSAYIQRQVALTGDPSFILAYSTAAGNAPVGATGGGAGGSTGASGGQTNPFGTGSSTGNTEGIPGNSVNTGNFSLSGGVAGANNVTP